MINPFSTSSLGIGYGQLQMSAIGFREAIQAKSGWFRLWLYNVQEESLKQDEQKQKDKAASRESGGTPETRTVVSKKKPKRRVLEPLVELEEFPEIPLRPMYRTQETAPILPATYPITLDIQFFGLKLNELIIAQNVRAANDEDEEDVELLLLAA